MQSNCSGHGGLVGSLLEIVPNVHLAGQRAHLDDGLTEKVVGLASKLLTKLRLEIVVFVPYADFYAIGRVVTLTVEQK